jgi:D-lactate dehydrogenase (cytochrome)
MPTHTTAAREPAGAPAAVAVDQSEEAIRPHLEDAAHYRGGHAEGIARPRTEAEIAGLLQAASTALVIGAQSSVTGGATPDGGLILSTERLRSVQEADQGRLRVDAGVPLERLQKLLAARGRWYAPFPTFTGAFVGGIVATNAAGAATFKYGTTRDWVDGLTVVLACGHVLDLVRGACRAETGRGFEIVCPCGTRRVTPGAYRMPSVPKCSAGYYAAPGMDLVDLFIGSEGTLGVIVNATLRTIPGPPPGAMALVCVPSEAAGLTLAGELRRASQRTWSERDPLGINVAAIESLDRRCLDLLREDAVDRQQQIDIPADTDLVLIVQFELPSGSTSASAFDEIAGAIGPAGANSSLGRACRLLAEHRVLDRTEVALPGDDRRRQQLLAFREAAPMAVNRRVGQARRDVDRRIDKTAGDMVVPFDQLPEMMAIYRASYGWRGLDYAIWGHLSDGNVHPNVIPRTYEDVVKGREAILEFGREAARLGGCPLAEHGVGRSRVKQTLLRQFYGDAAIDQMRAIKNVLDPQWKLAPGVIVPRPGSDRDGT